MTTQEQELERERYARSVGEMMARMRKSANLTQAEFAKLLGKSISYVTRIERAERGCDLADVMLWARLTRVEFRTSLRFPDGSLEEADAAAAAPAFASAEHADLHQIAAGLTATDARLLAELAKRMPRAG